MKWRNWMYDFSAFFPASLPAERRTYQRDLTAASVKLTPALPLSGFSASWPRPPAERRAPVARLLTTFPASAGSANELRSGTMPRPVAPSGGEYPDSRLTYGEMSTRLPLPLICSDRAFFVTDLSLW